MFAPSLFLFFLGIHATHFDYIVLGGGTSGLVVANRLSEDPSIKVAVVEAGDSVRFNPNVTNTTQFGLSLGTSIDWLYQSLPQQYANNKSQVFNAGKALGGTSTINGTLEESWWNSI
jgi:choline dehydrogenase-like flavoprotein